LEFTLRVSGASALPDANTLSKCRRFQRCAESLQTHGAFNLNCLAALFADQVVVVLFAAFSIERFAIRASQNIHLT
jgi:hypothetical protein